MNENVNLAKNGTFSEQIGNNSGTNRERKGAKWNKSGVKSAKNPAGASKMGFFIQFRFRQGMQQKLMRLILRVA
jgi:hypothetical protein